MQLYELASSPSEASPHAQPPSMSSEHDEEADEEMEYENDVILHRRTLRKLDLLLLPFLALLFLFNSLDKSNIGNAESAHFTRDIGLEKGDLNTAVALFFAFFVTLQPVGAALGRRYGMVRWVPSCMVLWGIATALHVWIRERWQLYTLRVAIGILEAGFYPVTVSYLSLFYTRYEFGRRLSLFYGQAAVGGALGGVISSIVFSRFSDEKEFDGAELDKKSWKSWQILFLLEGCLTIVVALVGYLWLPHSAGSAWFLTPTERKYATNRILRDRKAQSSPTITIAPIIHDSADDEPSYSSSESQTLLSRSTSKQPHTVTTAITSDTGISPHDILSAILSPKIWYILTCNILSAIPVYAFQVFLPLVLAPLTETSNPALLNLLTAPPYICGATTLYVFASWSDRHRSRLKPIFVGLGIMITGLVAVVLLPSGSAWVIPRYAALCTLFAGTFIASPLTVAWISDNTPSPGKRALLLGINGWGNLAGVFSAMLFRPEYAETGYIVPFWWTLACVALSAVGYVAFWRGIGRENEERETIRRTWDAQDIEREDTEGRGPLSEEYRAMGWIVRGVKKAPRLRGVAEWLEDALEGGREGDEKITFVYGL